MEFWLRPILTIVFTVGVYWIITLDHRRNRQPNEVCAPVGLILFLGLIGLTTAIGVGWGMFLPATWQRDDAWAFPLLFLFGVVCTIIAADLDARKIVWDSERILIKKLFHSQRSYRWQDVERADNMVFTEAWRLWFRDGYRVGVPHRMVGIPALLSEVAGRPHIELSSEELRQIRRELDER